MIRAFGFEFYTVDGFTVVVLPKPGQRIERKPVRKLKVRRQAPRTSCGGVPVSAQVCGDAA